jgi:(5-formylfuran-3-yl)methyl phosphate synthase
VAKLLVSVRSKVEALAALAGGAAIIDVKEPFNGSLGRAQCNVWREVRNVVPRQVPVSVALGELNDWPGIDAVGVARGNWSGLSYCKLGLSHSPPDWIDRWCALRQALAHSESSVPAWVAVVYIDWQAAHAPEPEAVIEVACALDECRGVLFDTWNKSQCPGITLTSKPMLERARDSGRFVALAGSLDARAIRRLAHLEPDIFAVRGSACAGGDRLAPIDSERVSILAQAARHADSKPFGARVASSN